jgi:hypothetical protein
MVRIEDVKKLKWWGMTGLAAAGLVLSGCGGSSNSNSSASLRLANATITHPSLDLLVNSSVAASATATDTVSAYVSPSSGSNTLQLNDAGAGTALATTVPTLTGGSHYTLLAYESGGNVKTVILPEDITVPTTGVTLRIYDAAIEAGKLDVYVTTNLCTNLSAISATTSFGTLTAPAAVSLNQGAGTWNVCVTAQGSKTDLRMSMPITIANQTVATVLMTPAAGGALLNGSLLTQQTTYTATRNTNVRLRLAAAVSGAVPVTATATTAAGSITIDPSGLPPALGFYTLVPASSALNVSVNSASVGAPANALVAGNDMTLLVYGSSSSSTSTLITDDNRPPTDATTVKLRLINGITGSAGSLTFTANSSLVAGGVAPGTASPYASVLGSTTAMNLNFTSSLSSGTFYSNTGTILNPNGVYTVMLGGDVSAPQLLIR